jgi:hypothetical protein
MKSLVVHFGALAVSSALALSIWLRDKEADEPKATEVPVWTGRPELIEAISYESKTRNVRLEPKQDGLGRWYVARFEKIEEVESPPKSPHSPHAPASASAPVPAPPPPKSEPPKRTTETFIAVKEGEELVKKLAPLMALRSIGKFDPKKAEDFGLDKPEGTLRVKISGKEHTLVVGGQAPGGSERYAKYGSSGEVFAVSNELTQILGFADTRLMERELHGFQDDEVENIKVTRGPKTRALTRVTGKRDAWADAASPTKADETVTNWLSKVERVRVTEYVEKPAKPPRPEDLVVRVDYSDKSKNLGFLELYKLPGEKDEYLARSEYSRWYTKVLGSAAEQVDRDVASVLK